MKTFTQLVTEDRQKERHHVLTVSNMNPPSFDHFKLIDKVHSITEKYDGDHTVLLTTLQDSKRNPLNPVQKKMYLEHFCPTTNFDISSAPDSKKTIERSFDIAASCVDMVYTKDESWAASDVTKKELVEWLQTFDSNQFQKIEEFFNTMPKLSHTLKVTNPKTGVESEILLEGLSSFFG